MLTFLKRLRDENQAVRLVNILIITLQITVNVSTFFALIISIGQEDRQFMMVKTYVALKFISDIDGLFTRCLPA